MKAGIELSILWFDEDVVGLLVRASNGRFAGEANTYVETNALAQLGEKLRGFPRDAQDVRTVELGTFDAAHAGGGVALGFRCRDQVGHAEVEVKLRTDSRPGSRSESVQFCLHLDASAVDAFVDQLNRTPVQQGETVELPGIADVE